MFVLKAKSKFFSDYGNSKNKAYRDPKRSGH